MALLVRVLLVAVSVQATVARAAQPSEPSVLQGAIQLYRGLDYPAALPLFERIAHRADAPAADRATALLYVGLISEALGDATKSKAAFGEAIAIDPTLQATPDCSPKVVALLEELRSKTPPLRPKPEKVIPTPAVVASSARAAQAPNAGLSIGVSLAGLGGSGLLGGALGLLLSGAQPTSSRIHEYANAGIGLLIGGAVLAVTGAVVALATGRSSAADSALSGSVQF